MARIGYIVYGVRVGGEFRYVGVTYDPKCRARAQRNKYGQAAEFVTLSWTEDKAEAVELEKIWHDIYEKSGWVLDSSVGRGGHPGPSFAKSKVHRGVSKSLEYVKAMSEARRGIPNMRLRGRKYTPEHRANIGAAQQGTKKRRGPYVIEGVTYATQFELAELHSVSSQTIGRWITSGRIVVEESQ